MKISFSIAVAHLSEKKGHSQSFKYICQNNPDGLAKHYGTPAKGHISPKTDNSSVKTNFFSHTNSQCPQNEKSLWHCLNTAGQNVEMFCQYGRSEERRGG